MHDATQSRFKGRRGLIALNAVLIGVLGWVSFEPGAAAQQARGRGAYLILGGQPEAGASNDVWVIDTLNQQMLGIRYDAGRRQLTGIGYRDLDADTTVQVGR